MSGVSDPLEQLRAAQAAFAEAADSYADAVKGRDAAVRAALDAGVTWATVRAETGMSPDTIRKAKARG